MELHGVSIGAMHRFIALVLWLPSPMVAKLRLCYVTFNVLQDVSVSVGA